MARERNARASVPSFGMLRLLDGAMGTELSRAGHDLSDALWAARLLLDAPDAITAVHRAYYDAGSEVVSTASYQASLQGFAARGISREESLLLLNRSVALAREAARAHNAARVAAGLAPRVLRVAASVGPYGAILADGSEFHGNYGLSEDDLFDFHRERLAVLWAADPDLLAVETIPSLLEARAIMRALREVPAARAWVSFQCRDDAHTAHGDPMVDVARALDAELQVLAMGMNCVPPDRVEPLARIIRANSSKLIVAYPNSGERWNAVSRDWDGAPDGRRLADFAPAWLAAGVSWLGGCCRTTPDDIRALALATGRY